MVWSDKIHRQFQRVPPNPAEKDYYGPYNKLLYTIFPPDTDFTVIPQYLKPNSEQMADWIVAFEVFLEDRPVLVLELKRPSELQKVSGRQKADNQIRQRLADLKETCPLNTLYGISAMGTQLCFYSVDTTIQDPEIYPIAIPPHPTKVNDVAPAVRWNLGLLQPEGEARFKQITDEIKAECAALAAAAAA